MDGLGKRPLCHGNIQHTKWMDWGKDHYATVTFSNAPEGRCIALGWMSNWQYQGVLPTEQYRGANTIARDLSLYRKDGDIFLKCAPSREIEKARNMTCSEASSSWTGATAAKRVSVRTFRQ